MKEYTFYRLPHHVTPGYINSKGEQQVGTIGVTNDFRRRMRERKSLGFDITDAYVLETGFYVDLKSAKKHELELQVEWDCLDHVHQKINHEKNSLSNKGRTAWNKGIPSTSKGVPKSGKAAKGVAVVWNKGISHKGKAAKGHKKEIVTCPHCGKEGGGGVMKRHHFDNCRKKS